jgi:YebC/PmpR family DNA-binding regulatory protein
MRGNTFTKLSREIIVAAKMGGGDPGMNPRLRVAVEKARAASVPVDNIKRAIARGTGEVEGADYDEIVYEGYGPGGAAIMVECYTENRNRTVAELRHAFTKNGGSLAENGSVSWQFKRVGQIEVSAEGRDEDELTLLAAEAGADDVTFEDGTATVVTSMEGLHTVNAELEKQGIKSTDAALVYTATNKANPGADDIPRLMRLLETLEDLDDVQETYVNVDITEDMLQEA